jgi:hypothetical protein
MGKEMHGVNQKTSTMHKLLNKTTSDDDDEAHTTILNKQV